MQVAGSFIESMVEFTLLIYSCLLCPWTVSQGSVKEMVLRQLDVCLVTCVLGSTVNIASRPFGTDEISLMSLFNSLLTKEMLVLNEYCLRHLSSFWQSFLETFILYFYSCTLLGINEINGLPSGQPNHWAQMDSHEENKLTLKRP